MAQQAARAETQPSPAVAGLAAVHELHDLGREWTVIRGGRLRPGDRSSSPTVLIHPGQGIAVLDVLPSETPDAVDAVRARLGAARFEGIFAGHLPVVHLRATPWQVPTLQKLLDDAFAALPPLTLPGGDAWAGVAARALTAESQALPRAEPLPSRGTAETGRQGRVRRRRRRRGRVLRKVAVLLLCLAALGGVLAVAMKDAPPLLGASIRAVLAPEAVVAPAAPLVRSVESPAPAEVVASPAPPPAPEPAQTTPAPRARPESSESGTTTHIPKASSSTVPQPPALETPTAATPLPAGPPSSRRQAAPPPPAQAGKPPDRTSPPPRQQRRQQQQEAAGVDSPPAAGGTAPGPETAPQRCGRVAARIGSGEPIGDADMRFFNQACIRW